MAEFTQGYGRWAGTAEVFSGEGRFLGNGADNRHVQALGDGRTRIDVSFVGPFKHAGHYFIQEAEGRRLYQGPANVGEAETLSESLVDANAYWSALGLSQRFFLMILPDGQTQLSLALMARGEHALYVVVGQNDRVPEGSAAPPPSLVSGTAYDLAHDPKAGRSELLLHRDGVWAGQLTMLDANRQLRGVAEYREIVQRMGPQQFLVTLEGGFSEARRGIVLTTNDWQAWTTSDQPLAGSYSLYGGRAASGQFHLLDENLRTWRREVVTHDGTQKALVRFWYRGGERVAIEFGVLAYRGQEPGDRT
jgi:hypothetical protein